jgi:hypothetical protein
MAAVAIEDDLTRVTANLPFTMKRIELPQIPARFGKRLRFRCDR